MLVVALNGLDGVGGEQDLVEFFGVQAQFLGVVVEEGAQLVAFLDVLPVVLGGKELVRHFEVLTLCGCGLHGECGGYGVGVHVQRHVAHGHVQHAVELLGGFFELGFCLGAVGALVVGVQGCGACAGYFAVEAVADVAVIGGCRAAHRSRGVRGCRSARGSTCGCACRGSGGACRCARRTARRCRWGGLGGAGTACAQSQGCGGHYAQQQGAAVEG